MNLVVLIVDMIVSKFSLVKSVGVLYCVCEARKLKFARQVYFVQSKFNGML